MIMTALIEYYDANHAFRTAHFWSVKPATTIEEAEAILRNFKIKFIKVVRFS